MKTGDIVFVRGHSIIDWLIRYFDPGRFNHVAMAMSDTEILEAQYLKKVNIIPMKYKDYVVLDLGLSDAQRKQIELISKKYIGREYDYLQIIWYVLRDLFRLKGKNFFNSPKYLICSELIYDILSDIGVIDKNEKLSDMTPNELYRFLIEKFNINKNVV